jgi:branched-subunit amino acid aminotransferase/4-amino-4-deoxychorismate lyase
MVGDGRWSVEASADSSAAAGPASTPVRLSAERWSAAPPLAGHKTLSRLPWDLARQRAVAAGADDVVLTDAAGKILETSVANVWVVRDLVARTPPAPARCLPGVMRDWLLENLPAAGIRVEECDLDVSDIDRADEVWISNAVIGVRRVGRVLDRRWDSWPLFERLAAAGVPAPGWPKSDRAQPEPKFRDESVEGRSDPPDRRDT